MKSFATYIENLISTFTPDLIRKLPRASHLSDRPIFIVGMPRSGTTLVEQILASHPYVYGGGELTDINSIAFRMLKIQETGQFSIDGIR